MFLWLVVSAVAGSPLDVTCAGVDPVFQRSVAEWVATDLRGEDDSLAKLRDERLDAILKTVKYDEVAFLTQWAHLFACVRERTSDERTLYRVGFLPGYIRPTPDAFVKAGVSLLTDENILVRKEAKGLLTAAEGISTDESRAHDVSIYVETLRQLLQDDPSLAKALLRYMLDVDAGRAVLTILEVAGSGDVLELPEPANSDYLRPPSSDERDRGVGTTNRQLKMQENWGSETVWKQLRSLATSEKWWVRLGIAELMRQVPEVRDSDVWDEFRTDRDKLVRERRELGEPLTRSNVHAE